MAHGVNVYGHVYMYSTIILSLSSEATQVLISTGSY